MGKILVSVSHYNTACKDAVEYLEAHGHEIVYDPTRPFPAYSKEELMTVLKDIDAAIIGMDVYDEDVFAEAPKLKAVAKFGVGVDNIDELAAARNGVYVLNAPGKNSFPVAEFVLGLIICTIRGVIPFDCAVKKGEWPRQLRKDARGSTLGLVGFGSTAKDLARLAGPLDMDIIAYDINPDFECAKSLNVTLVSFEQLLATSDIISLHVPGMESTYHMINRDTISKMKDGVFIINDSRGMVVDTDALVEALRSGKVAGAALDAFELEPMPNDQDILKCPNVICTPHIGGETYTAYYDIGMCTAIDVAAVLEGRDPEHCTNKLLLRCVGELPV